MPSLDILLKTPKVRLNRAVSLKVLAYAKKKNDPDYKKLIALRRKYLAIKKRLRMKYGTQVRPEVLRKFYEQDELVLELKKCRKKVKKILESLIVKYIDEVQ